MTTSQPPNLRPSSPERCEEISRHLLLQAEEELDKGGALQASENIWGATAHALKAIAQDRGWNHGLHNHIRAAALYLAVERGRSDWNTTFTSLVSLHTNLYEHQGFPGDIRPFLELARLFCRDMYEVRPYQPAEPSNSIEEQQASQAIHLRTLTRQLGELSAFGDESTVEELADLPPVSPT